MKEGRKQSFIFGMFVIYYLLWNHKMLIVFINSWIFDKNLQFTIDLFEKEVPYFFDLEMSPDEISIYLNDTDTVFCVNYVGFVP